MQANFKWHVIGCRTIRDHRHDDYHDSGHDHDPIMPIVTIMAIVSIMALIRSISHNYYMFAIGCW